LVLIDCNSGRHQSVMAMADVGRDIEPAIEAAWRG
jgi:hypothetical protein